MQKQTIKDTIVLVSPTSEDFREAVSSGNVGYFFPPLGTLLVAQTLKNAGYKVYFFDGNFEKNYFQNLLTTIEQNQDRLLFVGIYVSILQVTDTLLVASTVKEKFNIPVVCGGPMASSFTRMVIQSELIDFCIVGDGATACVKLADAMQLGKPLEDVPNLHYTVEGNIVTTGISARDALTAESRIDYEHFIDVDAYIARFGLYLPQSGEDKPKRAVPLLTGLGCSYKCAFCENALLNHKHVSLSSDQIVSQMKIYKQKYDVDGIAFFDEDFAFDRDRLCELTDQLKNEGLGIIWGTQTRANYFTDRYINEEMLNQLEASGCRRLSLGVESGSPKILKLLRKGITRDMVIRAASIASKSKIVLSYSIIINLPSEKLDDLKMTESLIRLLINIKKNSFVSAIHEYIAYPGTPLSVETEQKLGIKIWDSLSLEDFVDFDLREYNKDMVKTEGPNSWQRRALVYYMKTLSADVPTPSTITRGLLFIIYWIGHLRRMSGIYRFPVELMAMEFYRKAIGRAPIV